MSATSALSIYLHSCTNREDRNGSAAEVSVVCLVEVHTAQSLTSFGLAAASAGVLYILVRARVAERDKVVAAIGRARVVAAMRFMLSAAELIDVLVRWLLLHLRAEARHSPFSHSPPIQHQVTSIRPWSPRRRDAAIDSESRAR